MSAHSSTRSRLAEFALGLLDDEERRSTEAELASSGELRRELDRVMESLSEMSGAAEPREPSASLRERLRASIDPATRFEGYVERLSRLVDLGADRARELLASIRTAGDPDGPWTDDIVAGTRLLHFSGGPRHAEADCGLVRIASGVHYPAHEHSGNEWNLVLEGNAREDSGRVWGPGDFVHLPEGSRHGFEVIGDRPFVFAVVLDGPIRFLDDAATRDASD